MLRLDAPVPIGSGHEGILLLRNFYPPEDGFVWSSRRWCEIVFAFEPDDAVGMDEVLLAIDVNAFQRPFLAPGVDLLVHLNGLRLGGAIIQRRQVVEFPVAASVLAHERNVLALDVPDAASPAEYGGDDTRLLGLQLFSVGILGTDSAVMPDRLPQRDRMRARA